jgi:hypothetical protein
VKLGLPPLPQLKKLKVAKLRLQKPLTIRGIMSEAAANQAKVAGMPKIKKFV